MQFTVKENDMYLNHQSERTLATRLVLRYCIMCFHPAINPIPKTIPKNNPEISPIFPDSKTQLNLVHEKK
jgi:hypothetical protein